MTYRFLLFAFLCWLSSLPLAHSQSLPEVQLPNRISASHVLVLYKKRDPLSLKIAQYYGKQRGIPAKQIVPVSILNDSATINRIKFESIKAELAPHLTDTIKVIVLAWHAPYRVDCMSITSAFSLGFDKAYCSHPLPEMSGCHMTRSSPYYNDDSQLLWQQNAPMRLSMMLSGQDFNQAKKLIDRGIKADNSHPKGNAYLVRTHDANRSTRWQSFKNFADIWQYVGHDDLNVHYLDNRHPDKRQQLINKKEVMFYHTGLAQVPNINTNDYLPGAVADHLTSTAGMGIDFNGQMKAFRWLEAGTTASYGAVIEPCNFMQKFPNPQVLIPAYTSGDTLVEAYWKSVLQPGEGLFVGEPLARPWDDTHITLKNSTLHIVTRSLSKKQHYRVESQMKKGSPWKVIKRDLWWNSDLKRIQLKHDGAIRYRIVEVE